MISSKKNLKRELILNTVSQIVREEGVEKLTLEAVANRAGISKGGLLYYFPNKDTLILGMIEQLSNHFVDEFNQKAQDDPQPQGKWTRSYIETTFCEDNSYVNDLYTALSAAHFTNPEMLERLQKDYSEIQQKIENDGLDPIRSTLIRLAIDGLWFAEMFGLAPPKGELRQKIIDGLKANLEEEK
ncbi:MULTISPECIES: TetR/AcrR family transcriptional regulator [unclassified Paenibacillus]|uniref:TetR/AcrR family transcriptional regulator n=1 Tax=unclassified Paenibacillus TaxID=185978 RepID=UPI0036329E44